MMSRRQGRRKFTLTPEYEKRSSREFTVEEIVEFIEDNDDRNPEVVSVTVELDDIEVGIGTTN